MRLLLAGDSEHPPRPNVPILRHLTYDEAHAMELGLLGVPLTAGFLAGGLIVELVMAVVVLALAGIAFFRLPNEQGVAARLISRETWYFTTVFVVAVIITAVIMGGGV